MSWYAIGGVALAIVVLNQFFKPFPWATRVWYIAVVFVVCLGLLKTCSDNPCIGDCPTSISTY